MDEVLQLSTKPASSGLNAGELVLNYSSAIYLQIGVDILSKGLYTGVSVVQWLLPLSSKQSGSRKQVTE